MKHLFLHIGTEKTGTTTIQRFLYENKKQLSADGVLYPNCLTDYVGNQLKLACYALNDDKIQDIRLRNRLKDSRDVKKFRKKLKKELKNEVLSFSGDIVIMSNEHCSSRLVKIEEIERLKALLKPLFEKITIVVYIREQMSMLASSYSTAVKYGHEHTIASPEAFAANSFFDHNQMLKKWEAVFGKENITLRIFDKNKLINQDIVYDFCAVTGIQTYQYSPVYFNETLNLKQAEFLRLLNIYFPQFIDNNVNIERHGIVDDLLAVDIDSPKISDLLSSEYEGLYDERNQEIKERYFPDMDGKLFGEQNKSKDTIEDQLKVLKINDVIYIAQALIKTEKKKYLTLKESIDQVAQVTKHKVDCENELNLDIKLNDGVQIAEFYRDLALLLEKYSAIEEAAKYMNLAKTHRPRGKLINAKCEEYKEKMKKTDE